MSSSWSPDSGLQTPNWTMTDGFGVACCSLREQVRQSQDRLLDGLKKLNDTNEMVHSMKADLAHLQPVLEAKAAASAELLVKVISSAGHPAAHVTV